MTRIAVHTLPALCVCVLGGALAGCVPETDTAGREQAPPPPPPSPSPTAVIVEPTDDEVVATPGVIIRLAAEHITLAPAGTQEPNTGHLHLFVNHDLTPEGEPIPQGEGIVHLGKAQTEHALQGLALGDYTVIAVLGDWAHVRIPGAGTDTVRFTVN